MAVYVAGDDYDGRYFDLKLFNNNNGAIQGTTKFRFKILQKGVT